MGEILEFAAVVGVVLTATVGWRWANVWIRRLQGETADEVEELEERVARLERALESQNSPREIEGSRE
ncbi:MAG: hypothetical protein R3344_02995 [Acidobacteriota bacterium]|nr:hypothetical protein [Acidobacteriota bacterium]